MKKLFLLGLVLSFGLILNGYAQDKSKAAAKPAATTAQPEAKQEEVKTIFNYKDELKLTDKQENDLKTIITDFQKYLIDKREILDKLRGELNDLMKNKADLKTIKVKLEQIAKLQVDISYTDIETARNTENVLTTAQLDKWKKIQEGARAAAQQQAQQAAAPAAKK